MNTYEDGLNEAWGCAKRLVLEDKKGGFSLEVIKEIFGCDLEDVFAKYSAAEVVKKIKDWEEKQKNAFEIGDEIQRDTFDPISLFGKVKAIITNISDDKHYHVLYSDKYTQGKVEIIDEHSLQKVWTKTGRRFDIQRALDTMEFGLRYLKTDK